LGAAATRLRRSGGGYPQAAVLPLAVGLWLVLQGRRSQLQAAEQLDGSPQPGLADDVRRRAFQAKMETSPPSWDRAASLRWAYSKEAKEQWAATSQARSEALREMEEPLRNFEQHEHAARASMGSELRSAASRDLVIAALFTASAVAGAIASLL
jgi:hypothetical protein